MRGYFLCAASLAAALSSGAYSGPQGSQAGGLSGDDVPVPSPPNPFWRFDFNRLWAEPDGKRAQDSLDEEGLGEEQGKAAGPAR